MDPQVQQVIKEHKVPQVLKVQQVQLELMALRVFKVLLEHKVTRVTRASLVPQVLLELKVIRVKPALQDLLVLKVFRVQPVFRVPQDLLVKDSGFLKCMHLLHCYWQTALLVGSMLVSLQL
jgi:hypothetical protein